LQVFHGETFLFWRNALSNNNRPKPAIALDQLRADLIWFSTAPGPVQACRQLENSLTLVCLQA
jgi:hypothetical protein